MVTCPNCGKVLEDGTKFCEGCGAQIPEKVFCSSCGAENDAQCAFCQTCGASMTAAAPEQAAAAPVKEKKNPLAGVLQTLKKLPKKVWMFAGIGVVAVVAVVVVLSLVLGGGSKKPNVALYIKDGEIYYNTMGKKAEPFELTEKLASTSISAGNMSSVGSQLGYYIRFNKDGSKIFYPDRIGGSGMTLYYRSTKDLEAEPVKIDSGMNGYMINEAGTKLLYEKDDNLYLHDLKDKEKIASDVSDIYYTKDLSKIIYEVYDEDADTSNVYLWESGEETQKLANDTNGLYHVTEDLSVIYYTKDEGTEEKSDLTLYKQVVGEEEKEKIANELAGIEQVYDSGEIYYTKAVTTEKTLMDYVDDDLAASDAAMTEPVAPTYPKRGTYPTRPTSPTKPYSWNYDTTEDYQAALEEYNTKLVEYNTKLEEYNQKKKEIDDAYTAAKEQYNKDYAEYRDVLRPAWREKQSRDSLRKNLKNAAQESTVYALYYYNGTESVAVTEAMANSYADDYAFDKAVLVIDVAKTNEIAKVKLSEISSVWDVRNKLEEMDGGTAKNLVIGATLSAIEQEAGSRFHLTDDGSALYFMDDVDEEKETGDLYKVAIADGKAGSKEKVDTDVYHGYIEIVWDTSVAYAKNVNNNGDKGDLYVDGKDIDFDVNLDRVSSYDGQILRYYADYNTDKKVGTLKEYKDDKATKIADDVFSYVVLANGDILYLNDYSLTRYEGTLYRYTGGKATKLDEEVTCLIPIYEEY